MGLFKNYRIKRDAASDKGGQQDASVAPNSSMGMQSAGQANSITNSYSQGSTANSNSLSHWPAHFDGSSSSSRPASLYPDGDFRNAPPDALRDIKCEVMVNWLHSKQEERIWSTGEPGEGVVLKKAKGQYVCCPTELKDDQSLFFQMVGLLNVRV